MSCEYCRKVPHDSKCPLTPKPKYKYKCFECKEPILVGEEYIVNDNGDYAHWECVDYARDLTKFLGYDVKEMEDEDY